MERSKGKGRALSPLGIHTVALAERALPHIFRTKRMCAYSAAQTLSDGWPLASTSPTLKRGNVFSADCSRSGSLNGMVESVSSACATVGQSIIRARARSAFQCFLPEKKVSERPATGGRPSPLETTCSHNHIPIHVVSGESSRALCSNLADESTMKHTEQSL